MTNGSRSTLGRGGPTLVDELGVASVALIGFTIATGIWGWLTFVLARPQDFATFTYAFGGVTLVVAVIQWCISTWSKRIRTLRGGTGSAAVFLGPTVICGLVFLAITSPSTPADEFTSGASIYQFMGLTMLLSLVGVALGTAVFLVIVMPLSLLFGAVRPADKKTAVAAAGEFEVMSRAERAAAGGILLAVVGFAVSMFYVLPGAAATTSRGRMLEQFSALVGFQGNPVAASTALLCVAIIVVLVIVNNRAVRRRRALAPYRGIPGGP